MAIKLLKTFIAVVALGAMFAGGYIVGAMKRSAPANGRRILYYVDPMHPAYKSDKPGVAPDCGMTLEPFYADEGPPTTGTSGRKILYYRDPQHLEYRADTPGPNPETGNALEPVYADAPQLTVPPGSIKISPERQQMIGVKFATVEMGGGTRAIRTVGRVSADETRVGHVHTRIEGWIEKVFVDFTGDVVKKDEPMLTIYSPEMLASQEELLLAARARDVMPSLFNAARRRLQLWDLSDDEIEQVLRTGQPIRSITVHAPMSGFVTERKAFPNQKITPDSDLYTITDLSRVWIVADVFESDITSIKVGAPAYVMFAGGVAPAIAARVSYILPQVDPLTRTLKVRLDASNPGTRMKPDMFVNVEFGVAGAPQLTIPAEAVLDTGDRQTVFVDLGNGYLEPRQVAIGERFGDRVTAVRGLSAGERVVSSGTFLVDSESQLKAAATGMGAPKDAHQQPAHPAPSVPHEGHGRD
ncbi:MAG TPA: efflux RND transporter periplasmic adaptor subunit [Vicinamibacterales bacterium]|nr:efflux RND transporter periplasmic adaptor subunit [Vicinamibacterales bacterium]